MSNVNTIRELLRELRYDRTMHPAVHAAAEEIKVLLAGVVDKPDPVHWQDWPDREAGPGEMWLGKEHPDDPWRQFYDGFIREAISGKVNRKSFYESYPNSRFVLITLPMILAPPKPAIPEKPLLVFGRSSRWEANRVGEWFAMSRGGGSAVSMESQWVIWREDDGSGGELILDPAWAADPANADAVRRFEAIKKGTP